MAKAQRMVKDHLTSFRMIILSFVLMILAGAVLLCLPWASAGGEKVSFLDALFTSTSAACVTGLVVFDTATKWTLFGRIVILLLIQVGGLGVVTMAAAVLTLTGTQIGLLPRLAVQDAVSAPELGSVVKFMKFLIIATFCIEGIGALCLLPVFAGRWGLQKGLGYAVFHSVSAFCNAGFSNYPDGMSAPVLMVGGHCWLYVILSLLIILGGIGYPVLVNMKAVVTKRARLIWRWLRGRRYASLSIPNLYDLNTKIVLKTTAVLIVSGTVLIAFFEWDNTFAGMQTHEKLTQAFFNAVSPRTAGFISVNLNSMCLQSIFIYTLLMWIGGASQSTAGGVKVNAFAVAILNIRSILRGSDRVEFAGREVSTDSIRRANAAVIVSVVVLSFFVFLVTLTDPDLPLKAIVFECVSAFATVGSSLGITSQLQDASKVLLVVLMFIGRVGVVTLAQGLLKQYKNQNYYKLPQDNITIS